MLNPTEDVLNMPLALTLARGVQSILTPEGHTGPIYPDGDCGYILLEADDGGDGLPNVSFTQDGDIVTVAFNTGSRNPFTMQVNVSEDTLVPHHDIVANEARERLYTTFWSAIESLVEKYTQDVTNEEDGRITLTCKNVTDARRLQTEMEHLFRDQPRYSKIKLTRRVHIIQMTVDKSE